MRLSVPMRFLTKSSLCLKHQTDGFRFTLWFITGDYIWFVTISLPFPAVYLPFYLPNNNTVLLCFVVVEEVSPCRACLKHPEFQIDLKLSAILLPPFPESWNFNYESPHVSTNNILKLPCKWQYFLIPGRYSIQKSKYIKMDLIYYHHQG